MGFLTKVLAERAAEYAAMPKPVEGPAPPPSSVPSYPSSHRPSRISTPTLERSDTIYGQAVSRPSTSYEPFPPAPPTHLELFCARKATQVPRRKQKKPTTPTSIRDLGLLSALPSPHPQRPRLSLKTSQESFTTQRFAVLMHKELWKPDSASTECDTLHCANHFGVFGVRRHHCRKCGGIYCGECSSKETLLVDTDGCDNLFPQTPEECAALPCVRARVCDECYAQVHNLPRPSRKSSLVSISSTISETPSAPPTPSTISDAASFNSYSSRKRQQVQHRTIYLPALQSTPPPSLFNTPRRKASGSTSPSRRPSTPPYQMGPDDPLAAYPLRDRSGTCKRLGNAFWTPGAVPVVYDLRDMKRFGAMPDLENPANLSTKAQFLYEGAIKVHMPTPLRGVDLKSSYV